MTTRLLVGVGQADEVGHPREYLLRVLAGVASFGVEVQVAMFGDGPMREALEEVADVRLLPPLPPRSPGGLAQSLARRASPDLADRVHDLRTVAARSGIEPPDGIHLHGPLAAPLLRYVRDPAVPVTTYAHPLAFSILGLSPLDRDRLLARTERFIAADDTVQADLVAAGVDPARIDLAPSPPPFPPFPVRANERAAARLEAGLPAEGMVVAVPPIEDWVDCPDITLSLAWELQRLAGAATPPTLLWYGMPAEGDRRWPVDFDIDRMGLASVRVADDLLEWEQVVTVASVIVLPIRPTVLLPEGAIRMAAEAGTPVFCWEGHELAGDIARWGGAVVPRGDVEAMAMAVWAAVEDEAALLRARSVPFRMEAAVVDRVLPVELPLP